MLYLILITVYYFAVTISTSSRYVSMTRFMEKNKDDELFSVLSSAEYQQIHVVCVLFFKTFIFLCISIFFKTVYQ